MSDTASIPGLDALLAADAEPVGTPATWAAELLERNKQRRCLTDWEVRWVLQFNNVGSMGLREQELMAVLHTRALVHKWKLPAKAVQPQFQELAEIGYVLT